MELIYICKYAQWTSIKGEPKLYCHYLDEAKKDQSELELINDGTTFKRIIDIIPKCPEDIKRNEYGLRVCYIQKNDAI